MRTKKDVSSDDDDIFFRGNVKKHVSMYAQLESNEDQISSDSDSEEVVLTRRPSNGRTGKRRRRGGDLNGLSSDDKRRKTSDSQQKQGEQGKGEQKRASVFDDMLSSDDDIKIVSSSITKPSGSTSGSASLSPTNRQGRRTRGRPPKSSVEVQSVDDDDDDDSNLVGQRLLQRIRMANALADEKRIAEEADQAAREEIRRVELLKEQAAIVKAEEERKKQACSGSGKELGEAIKLNVRLGNEYKKVVRIRMRANLLSIIVPFCKAFNNLDDKKVRMEIDGEIVEEGQTAEDYDLAENNVIDLVRSK